MDMDSIGWWLIIAACLFTCWPLGVFLLIMQLVQIHNEQQDSNSTPKSRPRQKKAELIIKSLRKKRRIQLAGGIILALLAVIILFPLDLETIVPGLVTLVLGCLLIRLSNKTNAMTELYSRIKAIVGKRGAISLDELASVTGLSSTKLIAQLEGLLKANLMPGAYIDYSRSLLVLSADNIEENILWQQRTPQNVTIEQDEAAYNDKDTYISKIRALNDDIADEELSRKIDRIEHSVTKMFEAVERDPEKKPELERFLSYYLPTTLKILDAYANFEDSTSQGEKIRRTMDDIESTVETLAVGFERQLDMMYENDTLDIESDLRVLESMLAKDGLSDAGSISQVMKPSGTDEPQNSPESEN